MFGNPAVVGGGDGTTSSGVTVVPPAEGVGAPRGKRLSNAGGMQRVGKFSTRAAKFFDENIFWVFRNREGEEEASQSSEETSDGSGAAEGRLLLPNKKSKGNDANESPRPVFQQMMIGGGIGSRLTETGRSIVHGGPCNHPVLGKVLPNATRGPLSESQVEGALRDSTKAANDTLRGNVLHMSATRLENSVDLPNAGGPPVSSACAHPIGKLSNAGPFHQADSVSSVGVENTELSGCGGTVEGIDSKTNITSREVQCSPFSSVHVFPGGGCNTAAALHPGHTSGTDFGKNEFSGSLRTREMDPKDPRSPLLSLRSQPGNEPGSNEGDTGGSIDLVSCPVNCWGHSKGLTLDGAEDASFDVGCSQKDSGFEAFERYLAAGSSDVWGRRERESGAQWLNRGLHFGMTAGNEAQGATSVSHRIENGDERYSSRLNPFVNFETSGALSVPKDEEATGIITLEDVIEELLQEEILDEADHYHDIEQRCLEWLGGKVLGVARWVGASSGSVDRPPQFGPLIPGKGYEVEKVEDEYGTGPDKEYLVKFLYHPHTEDRWFTRKELLKTAKSVILKYEAVQKGEPLRRSPRLRPYLGGPRSGGGSGTSTTPYSKEQEERVAALLREKKERMEKRELIKQDKMLALLEEQEAKKKQMEEELQKWTKEQEEKMTTIQAEVEKEEEAEEEVEEEVPLERRRGEASTSKEDKIEKITQEWAAHLDLGEGREAELAIPQEERSGKEGVGSRTRPCEKKGEGGRTTEGMEMAVRSCIRQTCVKGAARRAGVCSYVRSISDKPREEEKIHPTITSLLKEYKDLSEAPSGVVPRPIQHCIEIEPGSRTPKGAIYRMSPKEVEELRRQLDELLEKGWIRPSSSPSGAPVLFVPKKEGELHMCVDYRGVNAITIKNAESLPRIDDLLDRVQGCKDFSKIDLKSGYHQIEVHHDDQYKTAFRTRYGHYEFIVMPFGLTNAPATFQCCMNDLFRPWLDRFVVVYLDDILVFSKTLEEHEGHLSQILGKLREPNFKINLKKCEWAKTEVLYLGHVLDGDGISPEDNASQYGIGAVLQQDDGNGYRPVEFMSARLPSEKVAASTYERELCALRQALDHWKHYLLGRHFKVYSDHETLRWLKTQDKMTPKLTPKLTRWAAEIDQVDFELKPIKGKYSMVVNALSRRADYFGAIVDYPDIGANLQQKVGRILLAKDNG
ncbi:hypothetical protein CBR_g49159 [Chara braunii]|uniref:Reverse transcriptase domain-containing protein n=1 Tax=Chara braunii TaxID=69332 RepID=A0A388K4V2_CHABU|nr:hypothetical protein CBR_g49159 [Chara braunii]|eukprot:GBG65084.1 hypothetical protein CBR_g49159 [Chara braunii]